MKSEEIRFAINFEYNEHNLSVKEFDLMLQNFAMTYHKEQLNMHDVSKSFFCTKTQNNEPKCKTECNFCKDMQKEYEEQKNDY